MRWGILGCGRIATHAIAPAIRWSKGGELVAVASREPAVAERKAAEVGAARGLSYEALIADPDVDAIYIGLPNGLHEGWALRAAEAGKHVLCDKSLTLSHASALRMASAFDAKGLRLVEGFMYRHHPQWPVVKELVSAIGGVRMLRASLSGPCPEGDHRWSPSLGGGALYDVVCYPVDVARYLLGTEPIAIGGRRVMDPRGVDRATIAALEFPGGVIVSAAGSFDVAHEQQLALFGPDGRIEVTHPFIPGWNATTIVVTRGSERQVIEVGGANHFLHQVEHFAALVSDAAKPAYPAENGVANAAILDAIARRAA